MRLNLKYKVTLENLPRFAEDIVEAAVAISRASLDYSVESLATVDLILEQMRRDGARVEQVGETLFGFGCYVGEVFVRTGVGRWRDIAGGPEEEVFGFPFVIEQGKDALCNPIGKVFKRVDEGEDHSIPYFFTVFGKHGIPRSDG